MRSNIVKMYDWSQDDVLCRLAEDILDDRRAERARRERREQRRRERRAKWCVNLALIVAMCVASFAAGLIVGVL